MNRDNLIEVVKFKYPRPTALTRRTWEGGRSEPMERRKKNNWNLVCGESEPHPFVLVLSESRELSVAVRGNSVVHKRPPKGNLIRQTTYRNIREKHDNSINRDTEP